MSDMPPPDRDDATQTQWYTVRGDQRCGPDPVAVLRTLIASGQITRDTPVWCEGMTAWLPAGQTVLAEQFPSAPPTSSADAVAASSPLSAKPRAAPPVYTPEGMRRLWLWFVWLTIIGYACWCAATMVFPAVVVNATPDTLRLFEVVGSIPLIAGGIIGLVLLYRFWALLQDGQARTTPWKAVGFSLIPLLNCYWWYVAYVGLAKDMNSSAAQRGLAGTTVSEPLVLCWYIVALGSVLSGTLVDLLPEIGSAPWSLAFAWIAGLFWLASLVIGIFKMKQFTESAVAIIEHKDGVSPA